jgi:hypothetical protein
MFQFKLHNCNSVIYIDIYAHLRLVEEKYSAASLVSMAANPPEPEGATIN